MTFCKGACIIYCVMNVRLFFFLCFMTFGVAACGGAPAPAVHYGQSSGAGSAGIHTVSKGDTLYSISRRYRLPMRDIVVLNNITQPFKLYVGQRIKLPPPQEYRVEQGDTLYGVSRLFNLNVSEVARLNAVEPPYILKVGQVLRLPAVIRQARPQSSLASAAPSPVRKPAALMDGVPVPQGKPVQLARSSGAAGQDQPQSLKISRVRTQAPKRVSSKFLKPVQGKIISSYGAKSNGLYNDGINIAAPRGTPVKAAENGVVVYAGNALKGSGNLILVRHEGRWMSAYAHLDSIGVRKGQVVKRGSVIGKVGSTGSVSTSQLHFEVRRGTSALDPMRYM